ncbi:MAG: MFS transporter [Acidobacteria bacterium]|nr:MFS transporter [Acidobacteriota bacterium]
MYAAAVGSAGGSRRLPPRVRPLPRAHRGGPRAARHPRHDASFIASAIVFGIGFGTAYPVFVAYVMKDVDMRRRGAAFGAILAAFDTGVGTGSMSAGWLIQRFGFSTAFAVAAVLSTVALPYFLVADKNLRKT